MSFERFEGARVALPHAEGPEQSVLSLMMQEPNEFIPHALEQGAVKDWFYKPAHRIIFQLLADLYREGEEIELVTLTQRLKDRGILENLGGAQAITSIYTYSPTSAHFEHHLEVVKDKWFRRRVLDHCRTVMEACHADEPVIPLLADPIDSLLDAHAGDTSISGAGAVDEWREHWKAQYAGEADDDVVTCGVEIFDDVRGGLDRPGLAYIGGLPSMGKTAMMLQMALHRLEEGERVLIFSLEMTRRQLVTRMMMHLCQLDDPAPILSPEQGLVPHEIKIKIRDASEVIRSDRLIIDDRSGISSTEIEAKARAEHRRGPLGLIGVDYLQLVRSDHEGVEQRMTEVTHCMQRVMKFTGASLVGLSQLTVGEGGKTHMKYARSMEEDADLAVRIEGDQEEKRVQGLRITKDRHRGRVGYYPKLRFDKKTQTFWRAT